MAEKTLLAIRLTRVDLLEDTQMFGSERRKLWDPKNLPQHRDSEAVYRPDLGLVIFTRTAMGRAKTREFSVPLHRVARMVAVE
jgi:hypothetical protein